MTAYSPDYKVLVNEKHTTNPDFRNTLKLENVMGTGTEMMKEKAVFKEIHKLLPGSTFRR